MLGITPADEQPLQLLTPIISRNLTLLGTVFYEHLMRFPELARLIASAPRLQRLRSALDRHLLTLGQDMPQLDYFESRLRVGAVHERNGIQPKWYVAAYSHLRSLLNRLVIDDPEHTPQRAGEIIVSLNKAICLDLALAFETYHRSALLRVESLMTQIEIGQDEIRRLAQTDQLTGLSNRRHYLDGLESEFHRCRRYGRPLCIAALDLDDFKSVNDRYGHSMGDEVLKQVGRLLPSQVRSTDLCGRLGGEEFGVTFVETSLPMAELIADRIRLAVLQQEFSNGAARISTSVSIGIAECTPEISDIGGLMRRADEALYDAKGAGKNCVRMAGIATLR